MKILIAGLSDPSAVAMQRVVSSVFPAAQVIRQQRGLGLDEPGPWAVARHCELCILDLIGLGLARWTAERQAQLHRLVLGDHDAVILAPPGDGCGWLDALPALRASGGARVLMQHPLTTSTMRTVLEDLRAQQRAESAARRATSQVLARAARPDAGAAKPSAMPAATAPPPLRGPSVAQAVAAPSHPPSHPPAPSLPAPAGADPARFGLTAQALQSLLAVCPEPGQNAYLQLICSTALKAQPQALQIGSHSGVVVHAAENWVASNISSALRKRLTAHAMMLQIVETRALQDADAFACATRLFGRRQDGRRPLDSFIWGQVYSTFEATPPLARGDLRFQLRMFPNFTRLPAQPDLFIQLALLSAGAPQTIDGLVRSFSRHDPRLVTLFVVCAVLSGMAQVLPEPTEPATGPASRPAAPPQGKLPGLKFIRALLEKLF